VSGARFEADYLMETRLPPSQAAQALAGEQSSGTFLAVPGETEELKARAAATVARLEVLGEVEAPALPGATDSPNPPVRALVTLSWPFDNIGHSLPNLLATIAGNLFELKQVSGLRLLDIRLPDEFLAPCPGPQFGISGTRRLSGVEDRPLIGTIIKPSIGLSASETAELVGTLAEAGIDFVKDDELQSDGAHCPFEQRVRAVMNVIRAHADRTGKKVMYAFNLTGELDQMRRRHDLVLSEGGTCVMASLNSVGLVGWLELRRHSQLPLHAHRNGWGYLSRHPLLGWSYVAWHKIWRLAGADHMHVNGLQNKFSEPDESVIASARACLAPLSPSKLCQIMPVFSSGQSAKQVPATWEALRSVDLIYTAGGGILAHPKGPAAGVASLREAWEAAVAGIPMADYARERPALAAALETYR
jgi:ribulose-bisphosphate carboxylase large chain